MNRLIFFLIMVFSTLFCLSAQESTSESLWEDQYYEIYDHNDFESFQPFSQRLHWGALDLPLIHAAVFYYTNSERTAQGLSPLEWNLQLETAAYHHSRVMVQEDFFSHTSRISSRRDPEDRAELAGITNPKIAENIAYTFSLDYRSGSSVYTHGPGEFSYTGDASDALEFHTYLSLARSLVTQWMNSPGHRANILSTDALELGVGVYFYSNPDFNAMPMMMATQNFQWFYPSNTGSASDPLPPGW